MRLKRGKSLLTITLMNQIIAVAGALITPLVTRVHLYPYMSLVIWLTFSNIIGYTMYLMYIFYRRVWGKSFSKTFKFIVFILNIGLALAVGLRLSSFVISKLYLENPEAINSINKLIVNAILVIAGMMTVFTWLYHRLKRELEHKILENERLKRLELEQRLKLLQTRVNPHFLFNTLNSLMVLVYESPERAEKVILKLSEMYRKILNMPERYTLKEEMELIESYLFIEKIRMGKKLEYEIELPEELEDFRIPPLLVEPLVENAVIHGLSPKKEGGMVRVVCEDRDDHVKIQVEDNGIGMAEYEKGFGIKSVEERLKLTFGDKARMLARTPQQGGCVFILEIPRE
ncbi:MAG: histidine kinase [Thermotogae bacterium]|nr:histidine kinase [Thermotogota bacterium]